MEKNSTKSDNIFVSEEEKIINWSDVQSAFEKNFGSEVYKSWLSNIVLLKEYNDHLVLSVPTRFIRDWVVSRYLDKIIEQVQKFKKSLNRIEFKISEEGKIQSAGFKSNDFGQISYFTSLNNIKRGNHYHNLKCEIFLVISGRAEYLSTNIFSKIKRKTILSEKSPQIIRTIPGEIHSIKKIGKKELIVLVWSNEIFNIDLPDTFS